MGMDLSVKVSVLTSLYKHHPRYVRQCFESLRAQTLQECEFILIDNGADENNKSLIEEYVAKDSRFKSLHLKKNAGMGAALNCGLSIAKGQYIGFLESDDFAAPTMFADLYAKSNYGEVDVIKSTYQTLDEMGRIKLQNNFPKSQINRILSRGECTGIIQNHVSHWSGIYNKEFLRKNKIDFHETPGGHSQDFGFILKCYAFAESIYVIPHPYVTYRVFTGTHEAKHLNDCMIDECELTFDHLRRNQLPQDVWEVLFLRVAPRLKACIVTADSSQKKRIVRELSEDEKYQTYRYFTAEAKEDIKRFIWENKRFSNLIRSVFETVRKACGFSKATKTKVSKQVNAAQSRKKKLLNRVFSTLQNKEKEEKLIFGVTVYKKRLYPDRRNLEFLGGLVQIVEDEQSINIRFFFIPFIEKKNTENTKYLKFLGLPLYYKHDKNFELKKQFDFIAASLKANQANLANLKTIVEAQYLHPQTFGKYKNAFAGKKVVLVCTGPTAKRYTPIKDAIHVGVNGAVYLNQVQLDYLFVQDFTIRQKFNASLNADALNYTGNECKKFFGVLPDVRLSQVKSIIERIPLRFAHDSSVSQYIIEDKVKHNVAYDLERQPMGDFCGTVFSALQFILYTHPKTLYIVGWDCGVGYAYNKPNAMGSANAQIDILKTYFLPFIKINYPDIEIIVINPVGLKGIFKEIQM